MSSESPIRPTSRGEGTRRAAGRILWVGVIVAVGLNGCATYHARPISAAQTASAYDLRTLDSPRLREFLHENHVPPPGPNQAWDLKQLTLAALYYQPSLAEARAQLTAARAAQITAGARPNPSFSITPGYDTGIPGNYSPWLVPLSVDVPIETAGKRGYRQARARHLAEAARWALVGAVWQVRSRVRAALLDLYSARANRSALSREEQAQAKVLQLLKGQLAAGLVSDYDVSQARIVRDTIRMERQQAEGQLRQARVRLATAIGVPVRALKDSRFALADFASLPLRLTRPEVRRHALLNRADVRQALAEYATAQSALQLEIAGQYPDVHLGPGYAWNPGNAGDSEWDLGLSLTLPIANRNEGPIAEARARRGVAAAHFLVVQAAAVGAIDTALADYRSARERLKSADALQQQQRRQIESVRARVSAGETEPLAVANAEVELASGIRTRLDALVQVQQAFGKLEDAVQSPLTLSPGEVDAAARNPSEGVP